MDGNLAPSPGPNPSPPKTGGSIEPLDRVKAARNAERTEPNGTRYELRDPFAEVTYRTARLADIVAKAEQLWSTRFTAVGADGARHTVSRNGERWERIPDLEQRDAAPRPQSSATETSAKKPSPSTVIDAAEAQLALIARVESTLAERYVIKRPAISVGELHFGAIEYRFKGDPSRIAFTETGLRLATDTNSPSVARSMVDVAEARGWRALRASGTEDFRRMVWLEAASRGLQTMGYEPMPSDWALLRKTSEGRNINRVEPAQAEPSQGTPAKAEGRGGGRKAVLVAIEAILVAKGVPAARREAVMQATEKELDARRSRGQSVRVKVHDAAAPSHLAVTRTTTHTRTQDRPSPTR
ncbi:LPD7 domain-containing protein [Piscinibacter sp. HJYY11]|uniref:LPD7 domain-containing protein n=1 Tax=Piscinibacter sp. HJYY11 TaxID=2801333 RepID=UPI00191E77C0|nr:LPD7 domain-containing protein [Piscinibacter sp. HJYY11]MBL0726115.1 hypothetical protein [Piscinibacter sp. HJYY11]